LQQNVPPVSSFEVDLLCLNGYRLKNLQEENFKARDLSIVEVAFSINAPPYSTKSKSAVSDAENRGARPRYGT
jgi:hypothetical protein